MQELASAGGEGNEFVQLVSLDGANLAVESWKAQGLEALRVSPDLNDQDMQEIQAEIFQAAYEGDLDTLWTFLARWPHSPNSNEGHVAKKCQQTLC